MITLLTDFGTVDYFVPAVKGAILSLHPWATLVDITHEIPPFDIRSAAFTLAACHRDFPPRTVHLAVVDPGVGSVRRPIVVAAGNQVLVGPDNGIFTFIYKLSDKLHVFHATETRLFRSPLSDTFHGRDVFAPLAAHLDQGLEPSQTGPEIFDYKTLDVSDPQRDVETGEVAGEVVHIDRFGNCVTNFTAREIDPSESTHGVHLSIGSQRVKRIGTHFAEATDGELFAYFGSAGYWEIGLWCRSAAALLGVSLGTRVVLDTGESSRSAS